MPCYRINIRPDDSNADFPYFAELWLDGDTKPIPVKLSEEGALDIICRLLVINKQQMELDAKLAQELIETLKKKAKVKNG